MKKMLFSIITALALALNTSCGKISDNIAKPRIKSTLNIPIKYVDDLVVNNSQEYRTAIEENEEEGIKEMRKLVLESELEEAWAYLPKKTQWIEIGKKSYPEERLKSGAYITKMELDTKYLDNLMKENDDIVIWQFHPTGSKMLGDMIKEREEQGNPMTKEEISKLESLISITEALPSNSDLINLILNSQNFYNLHQEGKITYKSGSLHGVTEFYLSEDGKNLYKDKNALQVMIMKTVSKTLVDLCFNNIKSQDETEKIQKLCKLLGGDSVEITFTQHDS